MNTIEERVVYTFGATHAGTTAEEALLLGSGVCQDHAHVFAAAARELGFPARYVSGYLMMNETVDQAASHAWAEAYVPVLGWVAFDASNGISPDERYVRIAVGRDYPRCDAGVGNSAGTGGRTACRLDHCGAVIRHICRKRFHDLLRRPQDRSRARVHVGHAHQCRRRFDIHLPQDACLGGARRAGHRADVGRQPRHHAVGGEHPRRALQGGRASARRPCSRRRPCTRRRSWSAASSRR